MIELLGRENVKISAQQMADITKLLEAEQKVEEGIQKSKQEKRAAEELQDSASMKEKSSSDKQWTRLREIAYFFAFSKFSFVKVVAV